MKYIISWFERPQGSPMEYENAQKRILEVFGQWKKFFEVFLSEHVGTGGDVTNKWNVTGRTALEHSVRARIPTNLNCARNGGVAAKKTLVFEHAEMCVNS